jgi:hypothetical protein
MKTKIIFLAIMIGIIVASCGNNDKEKKVIAAKDFGKQYNIPNNITNSPDCFINFGNGVYYYPLINTPDKMEFGPVFSNFKAKNKGKLNVISFAPMLADRAYDNSVIGYWINTEPDTVNK